MPNSRVDLLPLATPVRIGIPFHGLARDEKLTLPNAEVIDYPQPNGPECWLVEHPKAGAAVSEPLTGRQWLSHALLSGTERQIGGQELGANHWLYCDDNYAWDVYVETTVVSTVIGVNVKVYLNNPFGIFGYPATLNSPILLADQNVEVLNPDGGYFGAFDSEIGMTTQRLSHNKTGSTTLLSIGKYEYPLTSLIYGEVLVIKIDISGNGKITAGEVGEGIAASVTSYKTLPGMISGTSIPVDPDQPEIDQACWNEAYLCEDWEETVGPGVCNGGYDSGSEVLRSLLYMVTSSGSIINGSYLQNSWTSKLWSTSVGSGCESGPSSGAGGSYSESTTGAQILSFLGVSTGQTTLVSRSVQYDGTYFVNSDTLHVETSSVVDGTNPTMSGSHPNWPCVNLSGITVAPDGSTPDDSGAETTWNPKTGESATGDQVCWV